MVATTVDQVRKRRPKGALWNLPSVVYMATLRSITAICSGDLQRRRLYATARAVASAGGGGPEIAGA
jgi:hypothetical protein